MRDFKDKNVLCSVLCNKELPNKLSRGMKLITSKRKSPKQFHTVANKMLVSRVVV